jgi:hypothetical protein
MSRSRHRPTVAAQDSGEDTAVASGERRHGSFAEGTQGALPGVAEDAERVIAAEEDGVVTVGKQAADLPAGNLLGLVDLVRPKQRRRMDPVVEDRALPPLGAVLQRAEDKSRDITRPSGEPARVATSEDRGQVPT